ncbi:MAG: hypothetical protein N3A65_01030 [candidate division WOR-3 bacterium]|nr:hypothetical protein [candidate division WOR-3 bacterium]
MNIEKKIHEYACKQNLIDAFSLILFSLGTTLISITVSLFLLKSPLYGLIGLIPLIFYRQKDFYCRAKELDRKLNARGELISSVQIARISENSREGYSKELIEAFVESTEKKFQNIEIKNFLDKKFLTWSFCFSLISLMLVLAYPAFLPERFYYALNHEIGYSVRPASGEFNQGEDIDLTINFSGVYVPDVVTLFYETETAFKRIKLRVVDNKANIRMKVIEPFTYYFRFFDTGTEVYRIGVIEPIYLKELYFTLHYPGYTNLRDETKTDRQLIAPTGTKVEIKGRASQILKGGKFIFEDTINLHCDGERFSGLFTMTKSGTANILISGISSYREAITLYAIPDLPPLVEIFFPGYNINMPPDMKITIGLKCSDDYGLHRVSLNYNFRDSRQINLQFKKGSFEDTIFYDWDLNSLRMLPGDRVSYFVEVEDNAGQIAKSKTYYIFFPTMEQIYEEVKEREGLIQTDLQDLEKVHKEGMSEVKKIEEKLKRERELSYLDTEKLKEIIVREENVLKKIEEWQLELENTIEKLKSGILLDQKSIERLQEITKILQEIAPEELKRALENLKHAINKNPEEIKKAMEQLKEAQEELAKALERTLELLKRYQQEEKLRELAEKTQRLAEHAGDLKELEKFKGTEGLKESMDSLYRAIDSLARELEKLAQSEGLEQEISEKLRESSKKAYSMAQGQGMKIEDLKKGLEKLATDLQRMYEELTRGRMANLRKNLLETLNQLVELSKLEEELLKLEKIDPDRQSDIARATKEVAESLYSQQVKSIYVGPEIGKRLSRALKEMEMASLNPATAGKIHAREAMKQLNLAGLSILQSLKRAGEGSGSSTGMDEFLKNLSALTQSQMSIGQSLFNLFPISVSGLTPEQMMQIQRLAGKQRELREALESLKSSPEAGGFRELLDNLSEEMKEMEEALYQYKIDRKLIERQQLIISRLLDAERSIRQEDWTKDRKSRPGEDVKRPSPAPLSEDLGKDELLEVIQRALKQPYPEEYEIYIREYFRALLEEE